VGADGDFFRRAMRAIRLAQSFIDFARDDTAMKHSSAGIASISFVVCLICSPSAQAGHGARIDQGNAAAPGCMTTWTLAPDQTASAAFSPGGTYGSVVACIPDSGSPADLYPNGVPANDSSTAAGGGSPFAATGGEMFQFFTAAVPSAQPQAQVVTWTLANSDTEIEMNDWCPGGAAGSFNWGGATYTGGCNNAPTDFLFNSAKGFIGFVDDTTDTVKLQTALPTGWSTGGSVTSAPEINPSSAAAALILLAGGLAVLRGRRPLKVAALPG
jgi:hypothetical protein